MSTLERLPEEILDLMIAKLADHDHSWFANGKILKFARCSPSFTDRCQAYLFRTALLSRDSQVQQFCAGHEIMRKEFVTRELIVHRGIDSELLSRLLEKVGGKVEEIFFNHQFLAGQHLAELTGKFTTSSGLP